MRLPVPVWTRLARAAALAVGVAVLAAGCGSPDSEDAPGAPATTAVIGGPFTLTNHRGETVTDADFRGRPMLVYFGFTYCPDVCPLAMQKLALALERLDPQEAAVFQPILITIDPERDTPAALSAYVSSNGFPANLVGLTGSAAEIAAVAAAYKVYYEKVETPDSYADYVVDHSSVIYLMDDAGAFVEPYTHASAPQDIAAGLKRHLAQRAGGSS